MRATLSVLMVTAVLVVLVAFPGCGGNGDSNLTAADTAAKPVKPPPQPPPPALAGKLVGSKVVDKRKGTWGMFTMNPDGSSKVQVPVSGSVVAHCWSKPDAQLILTSIGGLSTVPRTSGTPTAFVVEDEPGLPRGNSLSARWSPTGRIVFSRQCYDIRLTDGYMQQCIAVEDWPNGPAQLLTEGYRDSAPVWSPDGDYIMFERVIGASITKMVMPAAGGSPG